MHPSEEYHTSLLVGVTPSAQHLKQELLACNCKVLGADWRRWSALRSRRPITCLITAGSGPRGAFDARENQRQNTRTLGWYTGVCIHRREHVAGTVAPCTLPESEVVALQLVSAAAQSVMSEHPSFLGRISALGARAPCSARKSARESPAAVVAAAAAAASLACCRRRRRRHHCLRCGFQHSPCVRSRQPLALPSHVPEASSHTAAVDVLTSNTNSPAPHSNSRTNAVPDPKLHVCNAG